MQPPTRPVYRPVDRVQARPAEPPRESAVHRSPVQTVSRIPEPAAPATDFDALARVEAPSEIEHRLPDFTGHALPDSPSLGDVALPAAPSAALPTAPPVAPHAVLPAEPSAEPSVEPPEPKPPEPKLSEPEPPEPKLSEPKLSERRLPEPNLPAETGPTIPGEAFEPDAHPEPRLPPSLPTRATGLDAITGMTAISSGETRRNPSSGANRTAARGTPRVEIALPAATPDGRSKRSGKGWLVALLILLILAAGVAAIVAVRLTAPDAPSAELNVGELVDRAKTRLQQWGLLPR